MGEGHMRSITVIFEDSEFKQLQKSKGKTTWRNFILKLIDRGNDERNI
jgi:hypothetical protein